MALVLMSLWCLAGISQSFAQAGAVVGDMRAVVVSYPNEQPVAGAEAKLLRPNQNLQYTAETNNNGVFEFDNVPIGEWRLRVAKPGYHAIEMPVVISETQRLELRLVLEPISTLGGEIGGTVTDTDSGGPIPHVLVYLPIPGDVTIQGGNGPGTAPNAWLWDYTDENGHYLIDNVPPGEYSIIAQSFNYMAQEKRVEVLAGLSVECNFQLTPTPTVGTGAVGGKVIDRSTSEPLANAIINVEGIYTFAPIYTDEHGEYLVEGVPAGERRVRAAKEGYKPEDKDVEIVAGEMATANFALEPREDQRGAISGRVVDAVTGDPLAGVEIYYRRISDDTQNSANTVVPEWLWDFVETNESGEYETGPLRSGDYVLRATEAGYFDQWRETEVEDNETTTENFRLQPADTVETGRIFGQVLDAQTSAPLPLAVVYFKRVNSDTNVLEWADVPSSEVPHTVTGDDGFYDTPRLRPGQYLLLVRKAGYEPARAMVTVYPGETTTQNFALVPQATVEPGVIEGQVLDAETMEPIGGALVFYASCYDDHLPSWIDDPVRDMIELPHVETNPNGVFRIADLRPGRWVLVAWAEGYRRAHEVVLVESGQATVANFKLQPVSTATGQVEGQLYNAVTDQVISDGYVFYAPLPPFFEFEDDRPAKSNNEQGLLQIAGPDSGAPFVQTDENGHYLIPQLQPGAYILVAWAPDHDPKAEIAQVDAGQTSVVDFPLDSMPSMDPAVVEGRVIDAETGDPIAGAEVRFRQVPVEDLNVTMDDSASIKDTHSITVLTGENGNYRVELRPGAYRVRVEKDGYDKSFAGITLAPGQVIELNFELKPDIDDLPGAISGVVTDEQTGDPIAGAWVFYGHRFDDNLPVDWYLDDDSLGSAADSTTPVGTHGQYVQTNNMGEYKIASLKPGDWYLKVKAEGYLPQRRKVEVESGETSIADFALASDNIEPGAIAGMIMDGLTSEPLEGVKVYYQRLRPDLTEHDPRVNSELNPAVAPVVEPPFVLTDANGKYEIPELRPGRYRLLARLEGYYPAGRVAAVVEGETTRVNFRLRPIRSGAGTVFGVVRDAVTSAPLAMAKVWIVPDGEVVITDISPLVILGEAETNDAGEYRIEDVPEGKVKVIAAREGYRQGHRRLMVLTGEEHEVNFRLQPIPSRPRGHLKGTVTDEQTGEPLAHALILVIPRNGDDVTSPVATAGRLDDSGRFELSRNPGHPRSVLTDRNGQYVVRNLPVGFYEVRAAKRGYVKARLGVRILEGEVTTADFALTPKPRPEFGSLGGRVIDAATGEPIAHAWVRYLPDDSELLTNKRGLRSRTDEDGRYGFARVPVGEGVVWAARRGYLPQRQQVTILKDQRTIANFALEPITTTGTLTGVVTDLLSEQPIEGALVIVPLIGLPHSANSDNALFGETDAEGRYTILGVPTGERLVVADHPAYIADAQIADVVASGTTALDFALVPWPEGDGQIEVEVVAEASGSPLEGVALRLPFSEWFEPDGDFDRNTIHTNAAGRATFRNLPHGAWSLIAAQQGYEPEFLGVTVDGTAAPAAAGKALTGAGSQVLRIVLESAQGNAAEDWMLYE